MDEMWSFYHDKGHQIWLWWAVDHKTNIPLAYTFGTREYKYLDELLELLKPFPIGKVYADNNFAYENRITDSILISGKKNTQKIERDHLTLTPVSKFSEQQKYASTVLKEKPESANFNNKILKK